MTHTPNPYASRQSFRAIPPAVTDFAATRLPETAPITFPNGLTIHTLHKPDMPVISLTAIVRGGYAEADFPGTAWLKNMMQREGTRSFSSQQISEIIDFNGANLKSSLDSHHSRHSIMALESNFEQLLPVFAEIVGAPVFPDAELEVRREALASNLEIYFENVSFLSSVESDRQIMGLDHPLARIDNPNQIRQLTTHDLATLHNRFNSIHNLDLFLCGNITPGLTDRIAEAFTATFADAPRASLCIEPFKPLPAADLKLVRKPGASQSAISITLPAVPRSHPDYLPLHLAVYALGGYFGSRLMLNIREEKGLTYGISASLNGYLDGSCIGISAETANQHVDPLIREVRTELIDLAEKPLQPDELTRMKRSAMSDQIAIADSPISIINHHITALTLGLPDNYFANKQAAITDITPQRIADVANKYLRPEAMRIAIAGNP